MSANWPVTLTWLLSAFVAAVIYFVPVGRLIDAVIEHPTVTAAER
jgi:hypothetical protein